MRARQEPSAVVYETYDFREVSKTTISDLSQHHRAAVENALQNILNTERAFETFAQVVDGLPTRSTAEQYHDYGRSSMYLNGLTNEPSTEAKQIVQTYRETLDPYILEFNVPVIQAYQNADFGSRDFNIRLLELLAVACHQLAALIFQSADGGLKKYPYGHNYEAPASQPTEPAVDLSFLGPIKPQAPDDHDDDASEPDLFPFIANEYVDRPPTELYHGYYQDHDQYPRGVADIVGYWAETRLFGGVILFDRGASESEAIDVFFHPDYFQGVGNIYQVSDTQLQNLMAFALEHEPTSESPRFSHEWGLRKFKSWTSMQANVFRDRYERKIPVDANHGCVLRLDDEDTAIYLENFRRGTANAHSD
ncbi:hypothetical protein EJ05DRAFT_497065 [Pseudovirgaria hyperparasitica]|uniref:Uncharacterized protein n=1 Tax=Pseudovirgaria hyperparasitica TaxID=470096 RepID=A0A6A6WJ30_9PEZI|nr:uncharacterized protein EJ05DRAFT_497065 [Pseudovirgaria hyperparasitica]KAF2762204.1 hypothetical protein EJ05DRAFT_497065 [Pseudovirgaria hyperparasitica]